MKKLIAANLIAAVTTFAAMTPAVQAAGSANGNFNVTVTLTSVCTMGTIGDLDFGTYTAFQSFAQIAGPVTATLTCTRGLTGVTANFDTAAPGSTAAAAATNAVGAGVIAGLQYDITATPGTVVAGSAATAGSTGSADSRPYQITGSMSANQAGAASAGIQTQQRTLTITY